MQTKSKLITGYRARTYDFRGPLWNRIKVRHLSFVNPGPKQRVLDVGCGTGKSLLLLSQKCDKSVELYGVEPSTDMLKQAKAQLDGNAKLESGTAQALPYADNYFDFVISTQVMHHLPTQEKKKMLKEMHRVLKPGGNIVVSDWGKPANLFGQLLNALWRGHAYVKENAVILTPTAFRRAGFKNVTNEFLQFGIIHHIQTTK